MDLLLTSVAMVLLVFIQLPQVTARCSNGRCGSPDTFCPTDSSSYCSLCSDPRLCTFSGEKGHVDLLGTFTFSHFLYEDQSSPSKNTTVVVVAQTARKNGRIFISGLQLKIAMNCDISLNINLKLESSSKGGLEMLANFSNNVLYFNNTNSQERVLLQQIESCCNISLIVSPESYFIIDIECFQIQIGLRPVETGLAPCIYVEVRDPSGLSFPSSDELPSQLCLTPGFSINELKNLTGINSSTYALNFLALSGQLPSGVTLKPLNFDQLGLLVKECPDEFREANMRYLSFLRDHLLVSCMSRNNDEEGLVSLARTLTEIVCKGNQSECPVVKGILDNKCGSVRTSVLQDFYTKFCSTISFNVTSATQAVLAQAALAQAAVDQTAATQAAIAGEILAHVAVSQALVFKAV
uniref:Uncharacterized protein n=1 Tax=Biomphalaria glabrata TaxID=6526 RepID=A0A2C9KMQ1_BIOGL